MNQISSETRFLHAVEMGLGAWQWGDRVMWQYGRTHTEEDVRKAFEVSVSEGIRFIDTAEVYGSGNSERLLGQFIQESGQPVLVATKFFPFPWRLTKQALPNALKRSLDRLGLESIDLYQVHWPTPLLSIDKMADGLALCIEKGWTRTVGVSNFNPTQMLAAYSSLARHKVPLASNQVHYSLLNRAIEKNGLLTRCQELGVRLIAYSPLEQGLLTGKYSPKEPPTGPRGAQYSSTLPRITPLLKLMTQIGQDHGGKSHAQVALNWVLCKGAMPIPGAKNAEQALQNAGALGWRLTEEEVLKLDETSDNLSK
jgi:aryl-alcohol dehydrogenase-like predicted oxidoreductase